MDHAAPFQNGSMHQLPTYTVPYVIYAELFADLVAVCLNSSFLFLLRKPFFHLNLRLLMTNFSTFLILLTLSRMFIVVNSLASFLSDLVGHIFGIVHNVAIYVILNSSIAMASERLLATILAEKYERFRGVWISILLVIVSWAVNGFLSSYVYSMMSKEHKTFPGWLTHSREYDKVVIVMTCVLLVNFCGLIIFLLIGRYNKKRWKGLLQQKLSHRYQVVENIRTARQLLVVLLAAFAVSLFFYAAFTYILVSGHRSTLTSVLVQTFDLLFALLAILLPCLLVRTHPRMWASAKHFILREKVHTSSRGDVIRVPRKSTSVVMQETNMYFCELQKVWK
ncbi:hypothetical protein QR680_016888 [Steinernema hermaphroditum]|uniref:Uncharacterized protein n=1 Tax=Steinernema hermaphroditum TaxID=289476 RepID=A0AA39LND2_9BILA|nr:hypothetical protein QR680_016888 [Steinernema hermaphroditum]